MSDAQRLFLGFALSDQERESMFKLQKRLGAPGKPVAKTNLHMTLAFLGQTSHCQRQTLEAALEGVAMPGFEQRLSTLVHWRGAGVLCLWGKATDSGLTDLYQGCQSLCHTLGLHQSEHSFNPHITLFRKVKQYQVPEWQPEPVILRPDTLNLYLSNSTPAGVRYEVLQSWPLGRA
ncbi:RNA 2',3'-cyclic phosphodiesterase [Shewanella zhangzhouensis]|nr:RNA 2',3'-cyclic phosphodiesterase [Shewanella zhangzhouensis]